MGNLNANDIQKILTDFRERTSILSSTLFTNDGFIVAIDQSHLYIDEDYHESLGAISAAIIALAEDSVETIESDKFIKQIAIEGGDQLDSEGFLIVLKEVNENTKFSVVFPSYLNLSVILFELNHVVKKLRKYFTESGHNETYGGVSTVI